MFCSHYSKKFVFKCFLFNSILSAKCSCHALVRRFHFSICLLEFNGKLFNLFDNILQNILMKILNTRSHFRYQISVLELLAESNQEGHTTHWNGQTAKSLKCQFVEIHPPSVLDLSEDTEYASEAALWGIEVSSWTCFFMGLISVFIYLVLLTHFQGLPDLGEIYPLGGSADRLGLVDPETGECLPAAMLPYCGRTLLEGLIRDLQVCRINLSS